MPRPRPLPLVAAALALALAGPGAGPAQPAPPPVEPAPAQVVTYRPPVAAAVSDPFRPPDGPYGAGNRGLEYATAGGEEVRAAAGGEVTFAGLVGHERYVTVLHADRLRTTYGRLATSEVAAGQQVAAGQRLGTAGAAFIWTARLGEAYVDPAVLLAASGHRRAWLVAEPPGASAFGPGAPHHYAGQPAWRPPGRSEPPTRP